MVTRRGRHGRGDGPETASVSVTRRSDPKTFGQAAMEYSRRTPPSRSTRWIVIESSSHRVIEWILRNVRDRDVEIDSAVRPSCCNARRTR
jgi:hypothetical protein